ncbi:MAG: tetraacyldisaccharide 4'-kinase [Halioglobus sp.]
MSGQGGLETAWYQGAKWLWLLRPLEWLFRLLAAARRYLYQLNVLVSYQAPLPVVVVGNITVGGTGKTPVVIALVEAMQAKGLRPGVVSRGYGATSDVFPHVLNDSSDAGQSGDEPLLIYRRTNVPCVVDPDRAMAVQTLIDKAEVDLVICDDGLQHYGLARDFEIAVLDQTRGVGNGFCLPAGPLREPASRLQSVDRTLYRGSDDTENGVRYIPKAWVNLETGEQRPLSSFSGAQATWAVAGIGQPEQFFSTLRSIGLNFQSQIFPDHHRYTAQNFSSMGEDLILMTEKDAVKCQVLAIPNAWYLRIDAQLPASLVTAVAQLVRP